MDETEFPICKAGLRDFSALSAFEKLCFSREDAWPGIDLAYVLVGGNFVRYKVQHAGQLIAFAAGEIKSHEHAGWIATIAVHPQWRGKGLGTRLMLALEQAMGQPTVKLTTRRSNSAAIALYRKLGYQQNGVWERYYYGGEDGLIFEKNIKS